MTYSLLNSIGYFHFNKARALQRSKGTLQAAKNLRKQGVPLEVALMLLVTPI